MFCPHCEVINSNMLTCFNGYILKSRSLLVIDMFKEIRRALMRRMSGKREMTPKSDDILCPRMRKKVEQNKMLSGTCSPVHACNYRFEVGHFANVFVVDLLIQVCSCKMWEISGIPCPHAVSTFIGYEEI